MDHIRLGKSGPDVSLIGIGTWQVGDASWGKDVVEKNSVEAIIRSKELDVNFIDTAETYGNGNSETIVGKAIKKLDRDELVVATKVSGNHLRYDNVIKACEESLSRLGLKEIDVYQVHWPDPWEQVSLRQTMRAMEDLYKHGKIRAIGVSNFAVRDLEEARSLLSSTDIVSDQVRCNMLQREIEEEVLPYCKKEGISVIAWSPLAQGILTGKYGKENKPSDQIRSGNRLFRDQNLTQTSKLTSVLVSIANSRKKTASQIALDWLITQLGVIPIPGAKNKKQAEENAGATGWKLTRQELTKISEALKEIHIDYF